MEVILNVYLPNSFFMSPVLTGHSGEWESHQSGSFEGLKWRSFYPCGYIALSLQRRHSSHSIHKRACASADAAQILGLLFLMRHPWNQHTWVNLSGPCWVSGEKETLRDRTWLRVALLPGEETPALYWYLALALIFLLTLCKHRNPCRFTVGFLCDWTRSALKGTEKLLHFPNVAKSNWPHFSFWITLFAWGS